MLMKSPESEAARNSIGRAIRAIERQQGLERGMERPDHEARRRAFFKLLDAEAPHIFSEIERAAARGEHQFMLGALPRFDAQCIKIFPHLGAGFFEIDLLNEWLHVRDLRHIFRAIELGIEW